MRSISRIVLVLGVALLLVVPAAAQQRQRGQGRGQGRGGPGGFGGLGMLINNEGVQKELKLDSDQIEKARAAVQKIQEKHSGDRASLQDLSPEERREKMMAITKTISEESLKALEGILKPDQIKRLKQIELQQRGPQAFTEPEVQSHLKLTSKQKESIKTIAEDFAAERRELFQPGGDPQEAQKKITALRKATMDKISAVLTSDQRETWKEMTGQPFEVQFQGRGRRGGQ